MGSRATLPCFSNNPQSPLPCTEGLRKMCRTPPEGRSESSRILLRANLDVQTRRAEAGAATGGESPFRVRSAEGAPRSRHTRGVAVPFEFQLPSLNAATHGSPRPRLSCCATRTTGGTPRSESSGQRTKRTAAGRELWQPSPGLVWGRPSVACPSSAQKHRDPLPLLRFGPWACDRRTYGTKRSALQERE